MITGMATVGLKQIAQRLGTTASTVSRVLNNYSTGFSVRTELREAILRTAAEVGYRPDLTAQALVRRSTRLIALLGLLEAWGLRRAEVLGEAVLAIERELLGEGFHLAVIGPETLQREGLRWRTDGLIVLNPDVVAGAGDAGLRYQHRVYLNGSGPGGPAVVCDDPAGVVAAVEHLAGLGHRRIAYRNAIGSWRHHAITTRRRAVAASCAACGIALVPGADDRGADMAAFLRRTVGEDGATAVIAFDTYVALPLLHAAADLGLVLPRDLSLVTFNDQEVASLVRPQLTTIALPAAEMGRRAVRLLLHAIAGTEPPSDLLMPVPPLLVVRASTAVPSPR